MSKFYTMGRYTDKGLAGFVNNPNTDRAGSTKALVEAGGAKLLSYSLLRGSYDFIVVTDVPSFDDFAAIKLVVEASGAVENLTMLEAIDFGKATAKASKIGYKAPGQ